MTTLTCAALSARLGAPLFSARAAIALGVASAFAPMVVLAEAQVPGNPDAVSIEVQNATVEEILFGFDLWQTVNVVRWIGRFDVCVA